VVSAIDTIVCDAIQIFKVSVCAGSVRQVYMNYTFSEPMDRPNVNPRYFMGILSLILIIFSLFSMEESPEKLIAIGFISTIITGWVSIHLYAHEPRQLTAQDLKYFSANLVRTEEVQTSLNNNSLQLWLQGQPIPFLSSSIQYPGAYDKSILSGLLTGVRVRIGCTQESLENPNFNRITNQKSYDIESLDINDRAALTLQSSNVARAKNHQFGKILMPIMFVLSLYLIFGGVKLQKQNSAR
jgi:hypothetical protein